MSKPHEIAKELHHSVTDAGTVNYALCHLLPNLHKKINGEKVMNHWHSDELTDAELIKDSARYLEYLLIIVNRLRKGRKSCGECINTGTIIERGSIAGCCGSGADEPIVCPKCHGRF